MPPMHKKKKLIASLPWAGGGLLLVPSKAELDTGVGVGCGYVHRLGAASLAPAYA